LICRICDLNLRVDNQFGTAEFITYFRELEVEPNLVVNMSTATAMDAANWVEYCNGISDSYYAIWLC